MCNNKRTLPSFLSLSLYVFRDVMCLCVIRHKIISIKFILIVTLLFIVIFIYFQNKRMSREQLWKHYYSVSGLFNINSCHHTTWLLCVCGVWYSLVSCVIKILFSNWICVYVCNECMMREKNDWQVIYDRCDSLMIIIV